MMTSIELTKAVLLEILYKTKQCKFPVNNPLSDGRFKNVSECKTSRSPCPPEERTSF